MKNITVKKKRSIILILSIAVVVIGVGLVGWLGLTLQTTKGEYQTEVATLNSKIRLLSAELASSSAEVTKLLAEDQRVRNDQLAATMTAMQKTFLDSSVVYEDILALDEQKADLTEAQENLAKALAELSDQNYTSASASLVTVKAEIKKVEQKLAAAAVAPTPQAPVSNTAPDSGYSRQAVETEQGKYVVSLIAAELGSTKVIVDTASGSDCGNDCPVLSLGDYVSRNGGYAGVNGTYFCPATYPSCAGKTNTFDLLLMNKDKTYFNSSNNVYSNNPAVIFGGGYIRFVGSASEWGRDTGIDSMLSNYPLLVSGNQVRFTGDGDIKKGSKGNRSFVANRGNTVYIGVVHGATVAESALALKTLGMDNALNLDSGGSTALWSGGYKVGPGRNIPNAIVFVRK